MNGFKPGVWVTHGKNLHRVLKVGINQDTGDYVCIVDIPYFADTWLPQSKFDLWEPERGQWCWFWGEFDLVPKLAQFIDKHSKGYHAKTFSANDSSYYSSAEPFIGKLLSLLKDNK